MWLVIGGAQRIVSIRRRHLAPSFPAVESFTCQLQASLSDPALPRSDIGAANQSYETYLEHIDFGDGTTAITEEVPQDYLVTLNGPTQHPLTHTYAAAGTYTVKYWVEDDHDQADPNFSPQIWYTNVNVVAAALDPSGDLLVGGDGAPTRVASPERQRRACWAVTAHLGAAFLPRRDAAIGG